MANSALVDIRTKVRRITRRMSEAQLSTIDLDKYINSYVLYDFPETLRLFNLRTTFSFYTTPFIDTYSTTTNPASPLYDFTNKYITTDEPVYIAGYQAVYSESRTEFYNVYPLLSSIQSIGTTGDGATFKFAGVINTQQQNMVPPQGLTQFSPLLHRNVLFSSIDNNANGLAMQDSPILDATTLMPTNYGYLFNALTTNSQPYNAITNPNGIPTIILPAPYALASGFPIYNYINYITGEYVVSFATAPAPGLNINSQTVQTSPTIPKSLLFFDGDFIVRPVPDQSYKVQMEVFAQPTALLDANQSPELAEWWQLIAWNAAKKVFEENDAFEDIQRIMPSLKEQEDLVNRRTIVQQTNQSSPTIYGGQGTSIYYNTWGWGRF